MPDESEHLGHSAASSEVKPLRSNTYRTEWVQVGIYLSEHRTNRPLNTTSSGIQVALGGLRTGLDVSARTCASASAVLRTDARLQCMLKSYSYIRCVLVLTVLLSIASPGQVLPVVSVPLSCCTLHSVEMCWNTLHCSRPCSPVRAGYAALMPHRKHEGLKAQQIYRHLSTKSLLRTTTSFTMSFYAVPRKKGKICSIRLQNGVVHHKQGKLLEPNLKSTVIEIPLGLASQVHTRCSYVTQE